MWDKPHHTLMCTVQLIDYFEIPPYYPSLSYYSPTLYQAQVKWNKQVKIFALEIFLTQYVQCPPPKTQGAQSIQNERHPGHISRSYHFKKQIKVVQMSCLYTVQRIRLREQVKRIQFKHKCLLPQILLGPSFLLDLKNCSWGVWSNNHSRGHYSWKVIRHQQPDPVTDKCSV